MRILLTGAGGAAAISVYKSLHPDHEMYMADIDPCAAGLYLVPAERRMIILPGQSANYLQDLIRQCVRAGIEVLIPTVDAELLPIVEAAEQFQQLHIQVPISSAETLTMCRDKYQLLSFCEGLGVTPVFSILTKESDKSDFPFPCFAKPRKGAGSTGAMIIEDALAWDALPKDGSYLIQELLPGEEYSVDVYIHSNGVALAAVPRLRMKIDSGIAVAAQTKIMPELSRMALDVAKKTGIRFVANIQFKADKNGQFKLLEINPRFPGTLPLTAAAGIDIPKLLIKDLQGEPISDHLLPFKELMVVRYWTEQFFAIEEWQRLCQV
ncbi:MAG: ATP-grasp domain-containing protein [Tatlockia sp.]|jgi:carbamoyl-phosphate synthase large subunit